MATAATLRNMSDDQLLDEQTSVTQELFNVRFQFATGQTDNSSQLGSLRRDIARINTILREREIAAAEAVGMGPGAARPVAASPVEASPDPESPDPESPDPESSVAEETSELEPEPESAEAELAEAESTEPKLDSEPSK